MTKLAMVRDINGYNTFGLMFADVTRGVVPQAGLGEKTITVPADTSEWLAVFSFEPGTSVWVANNKSVIIPQSSDPAPVACAEQNPGSRYVKAGDILHFATEDTSAKVEVGFYGLE